ncbi:MAG TPA: class I SAM-dependent methyltransferase [Methanocella sp.]|nr:class I SAM-dependent methyltransferase [Methanocella sp.]
MHQDSAKTKRDFNKAAASWDTGPRVKLAGDIARAIQEDVSLSPEMDLLDFGCGTGLLALNLQPYVRTVTGVDSAQGMLDVMCEKIRALKIPGVKARYLDIEKGDRIEGQYHLVVSSMSLHHIREIRPLLEQLYKVLAPSGRIAIADLDLDEGEFHEDHTGVFHDGFDRSELRQAIAGAGFDEIRDRTAAVMAKPVDNKQIREFTIFLVTARKSG